MRRRTLLAGGIILLGAVAATLALTGGAGRRGGSPADPALAGDIAARSSGGPQLSPVPWTSVPPAVDAWIAAHAAAPAQGAVVVGGSDWVILTSGTQPARIRLFPLMLARNGTGPAEIDVALASGGGRGGGRAALAVAVPAAIGRPAFRLHVLGGTQGVPLGPLPAATCSGAPDALAAARACAAKLGLGSAAWSGTGRTARAVSGGQTFVVTFRRSGAGYVPSAVTWSGAG